MVLVSNHILLTEFKTSSATLLPADSKEFREKKRLNPRDYPRATSNSSLDFSQESSSSVDGSDDSSSSASDSSLSESSSSDSHSD